MLTSYSLKRMFLIPSVLLLIHATSAAGVSRFTRGNTTVTRVALDQPEIKLGPNESVTVHAKALSALDQPVPNARITWTVPQAVNAALTIKALNNTGGIVVISSGVTAPSVVIVRAKSGRASADLTVRLVNPVPTEIVFPEGNKVELAVQGHKTIKAYVLDAEGNRIQGADVRWSLADPDHEAFVLVGPNINKGGVNTVEITWLGGKADIKIPSEVKLIAKSGEQARGVFRIDYQGPKPEAIKLTVDAKKIEIRPGESANAQLTIKGEDDRTIKVEAGDIKAEIADENARSYLKTAILDGKTVAIMATYGDPKTPPRELLETALIIRVGSALASVPVTYRRNAATVVWDVLPPNIVGANYGRAIKKNYYCIEVTIHNHSGADLALAGLQFEGEVTRPNTSYSTVHGSLAKRELTHPRTMTLAIVDSFGSLMTGFLPFFHNLNHTNNFSNSIAIISNPLAKGLERVWKDPYPNELARFESDVLHDDKIIPNGQVFKTKIFVPMRALFETNDERRQDLQEVRKELGQLWVLGYKFQKGPVETLGSSH